MAWADTTIDPTLTSIDYPGTQTAADPAGGESIIINGTGFQTGITCTVGGTSATTVFNSATQITITSPAKAAGQYTVAVTNTDGGSGSSANFIQYSGVPVWSTNSGSLGSVQEGGTTSFQVTATEGSDTIEYAVTSGSLPSGYSLATATGAITGTAPSVSADTTSTFSITATDDENQTSSARSFSITVTNILPSQHFNTALYTGNATARSISVGFQPDFTWIKDMTTGYSHALIDAVRGPDWELNSNDTTAEYYEANGLTAFTSTGFNLGTLQYSYNKTSSNYASWNWKGGGAPSATNSAGAGNAPTSGSVMIDGSASTATLAGDVAATKISANTTLGYSMVEFTNGASGTSTIAHGLDTAPEFIMLKQTDAATNWVVYNVNGGAGKTLILNGTNTYSADVPASQWGSVPTSTVFTVTNNSSLTNASSPHIAYCFASKAGLSKVGSFTGNGTSSKIIETGFRVGWVMLKNTTTNGYKWYMLDDKRGGSSRLYANDYSSAVTNSTIVKFLENGFEVVTSDAEVNKSGDTIVYLAFASDSTATTPSLASSFSAVNNTSPSTNQAIAAGFTPDMAWIKGTITSPTSWGQYDTIRGSGWSLQSDNTGGDYDYSGHPNGDLAMEWTSTGYTTPPVTNANICTSSGDFINYFWKAGGLGSINTTGTITGIVSANAAAGVSVVKYIGNNTSGATIGHGLNAAPNAMIVKRLDSSGDWDVYHSSLGATKYMILDTNQAVLTASNIWNDTAPTSTVFSVGNHASVNASGGSYIAYLFTSITGFCSIGSYTGNNPTAVSVNLGFNPDLLIVKNTTNAADWTTYDKQRSPTGNFDDIIYLNLTDAQATTGGNWATPTATGFTTNSSGGSLVNENGSTFAYIAFKQN